MKTLITLAAIAALSTTGFAAQGDNISAPGTSRQTVQPQPSTSNEGALQHAARIGNPLEAVNPFAPVTYGSGRGFVVNSDETEVSHSHVQARPVGIRLFSFSF
jgi:hypothetical protein